MSNSQKIFLYFCVGLFLNFYSISIFLNNFFLANSARKPNNYKTTALGHNHRKNIQLNSVSPTKTISVNSSLTNSPNVPSRKGNFTIRQRYDGEENTPGPTISPVISTPETAIDVEEEKGRKACPW